MASRAARKIVEEYLSTRQALSTVPSSLGAQLEALQNGLTGSEDEYGRVKSSEDQYARYALLVRLWAILSEDEQRVLAAQYCPIGTATYIRKVHQSDLHRKRAPVYDTVAPCGGETQRGSSCKASRVPGEARCFRHIDQSSPLEIRVTARGEEYTEDAEEPGYCYVRGINPIYPGTDEVAVLCRMSSRDYRKHQKKAYQKIEENQMFMMLTNEFTC